MEDCSVEDHYYRLKVPLGYSLKHKQPLDSEGL